MVPDREDKAEQTISVGAREISCRLNGNSKNFDKTAENLARAAQIVTSGEALPVWIGVGAQVLSGGNRVTRTEHKVETTGLVAFLGTLHPPGQAPARDAAQRATLP